MTESAREHLDAQQAGHEPDTVRARSVAWVSGGLALLVVLAVVLMGGLLGGLNRLMSPAPSPSQVELPPPRPDGPRLNPDQPLQLEELRRKENALLERYGWVDREQGVARIPIKRAIAILAERGLTESQADKETPDENAQRK